MDEFLKNKIIERLKREPNALEWHLFEAMWSEHCGYLHSKKQLEKLKSKGAIFADENAGGVQINGWGVFFKMESHNHPCAVEPYQGAATGIGGILRDVLALGARPVALSNSLKFSAEDKHIINGVTSGISDYGNCTGVANIAGEVIFDNCYSNTPLVNVLALGLAPLENVKLSKLKPNLNILVLGSATGFDGVGGAAFASRELGDNTLEEKIHVQIGDPYVKKNLIEASLKILALRGVFASQDCGAAGLLSSTCEMAFKGKCSITLDLDKLHKVKNIEPWQIMLSETQERMVFAADDSVLEEVLKIAKEFELEVSIIGKSKEGSDYEIVSNGKTVANLPLKTLCDPYLFDLEPAKEPLYIKENAKKSFRADISVQQAVEKLVTSPEFASKKWFFEQFDYGVGGKIAVPPALSGCGVLKMPELKGYIGITVDSKPRECYLDPYLGAQNTFLESYRNLVSSGLEPIGLTNCLNFGNPEKDEVKFQFVQTVDGLSLASKQTFVPVVSGNVSFYNENPKCRVYPTLTLGMLGFCKNDEDLIETIFKDGEYIFLLGKKTDSKSNIGGSLYQSVLFDFVGGYVDKPDFSQEAILKNAIFDLKKQKLLNAAKDVSKGGLLGALLEALFVSNIGFSGNLVQNAKCDILKLLFGEINARYLLSTDKPEEVRQYFEKNELSNLYLGRCFGDKIEFDGYKFDLNDLRKKYFRAIQDLLEN